MKEQINKLTAKLDVQYNRLVKAEIEQNREEIQTALNMIAIYKSELEAARYMKPFATGTL